MIYLQVILWLAVCVCVLYSVKNYFRGGFYVGTKPNLEGYVAIVTGGGSGVGRQAAKDLATQGCTVIIADVVNSEHIATEINSMIGCERVSYRYLDLGDFSSIRHFVDEIQYKKIDFLVNNAGVMGLPKLTLTKSKFQSHYGINYIGHFYLTHLLWPKLNKSSFFRVVILSSITHKRINGFGKPTTLQMGKFNFQSSQYDRNLAYGRSKLCLTLFARALKQIIDKDKGIAVSVHPGIVRSNITRHMFAGTFLSFIFALISPAYWLFTKSCEQGVQTVLFALYSDKKILESGAFYSDCKISPCNPLVEQHWKKLFELTQQSLEIEFGK